MKVFIRTTTVPQIRQKKKKKKKKKAAHPRRRKRRRTLKVHQKMMKVLLQKIK
jgi:hypothetical protein